MAYITRLSHFRFDKEGDDLVVTSERDDSFEKRFDWPDNCTMTDDDLVEVLHESYYTKVKVAFEG